MYNFLTSFILMIRYNFSTLILFELFHKLLFLFGIPIIKHIIDISLVNSNIIFLNLDLVKKLISKPNSLFLILLVFILLVFYFIFEFIAIILCFNESIQYKKIGILRLIKISLLRFVDIFKLNNIGLFFFLFFLFLILLVNSKLILSFFGNLSFIENIQFNLKLTMIWIVTVSFIYLLTIRLTFIAQELVLNTDRFNESMKSSAKLLKGKYIKTVFITIASSMLAMIIGIMIYRIMILGIGLFTKYYVPKYYVPTIELKDIFINRCFRVNDYVRILSMFFYSIIYIGVFSSLYHKYKGNMLLKVNSYEKNTSILKSILKFIIILLVFKYESIVVSDLSKNGFIHNSLLLNTSVTGHRLAAAKAPENTLAGLNEAINSKSKYIEIDVQETKDGEIIVVHDSNLKRLTGVNKNIWDVDYNELKTYDAGSHFSNFFAGERIPTLQEVIEKSKGKVKLFVEIKVNGHERNDVTKKVLDALKKNNIEKSSIIASMNKDVLKRVKDLDKNLATCHLESLEYINFCDFDYIDIYGMEAKFVDKNMVEEIHRLGKQIFVWTVNDSELIEKMISLNVDSIITDNPYLAHCLICLNRNNFINEVRNILFYKDIQ